MRNYFIYNGVDSRDYGVYISGQGTFNAPQKAYTFYNIPGRNGALIGYDKRFENVNITYQAFIYKDFEKNLANFRSFLLSVNGYARLEDSYHPDEFRAAAYVGPFDPEVTSKNDAGSFTITFNCKPQRYLKSGETQYVLGGSSLESNGSHHYLYGPSVDTTVLDITLPLEQSGSGNPTTYKPRPIKKYDGVDITIDGEPWYSRTFTTAQQGAAGTIDAITGAYSKTWAIKRLTSVNGATYDSSGHFWNIPNFFSGTEANTAISSHFRKYSLSDPIHGESFYLGGDGSLRVFHLQNALEENNFLRNNEVYFAAQLTTPETYTLTAFAPTYPDDWCSIDSDVEFKLKYNQVNLDNPTPFNAKPILRVYGTGTFAFNGVTVTVSSAGTYTDIDCELMDCYEGSSNRNQYVSFSGYDFPELVPGENSLAGSTITTVYIVPRWWRL